MTRPLLSALLALSLLPAVAMAGDGFWQTPTIAGAGKIHPLPQAAYQADTSQLVYDALSKTAQRILAQGCSVVLDAAFMQEAQRAELADLARGKNVRFVSLFLTADLATRLGRIEQRKRMRRMRREMLR